MLDTELLYKISFGEMPRLVQDSAENYPSGIQFPGAVTTHANVCIAGDDIMMSDAILSRKASYSSFTLILGSQQVEEGKRRLDNFAASGEVEVVWQEMFWTHSFGKITDRFGVPRMTNVIK